jgi:hypothetical protein
MVRIAVGSTAAHARTRFQEFTANSEKDKYRQTDLTCLFYANQGSGTAEGPQESKSGPQITVARRPAERVGELRVVRNLP